MFRRIPVADPTSSELRAAADTGPAAVEDVLRGKRWQMGFTDEPGNHGSVDHLLGVLGRRRRWLR